MLPCRLPVAALQDAGVHRRSARVAVDAGQHERAGAVLGKAAAARHGAGIGAGACLVEDHRGVVQDIALKAGAVALQDAGRHRRAAAVAVGARQDQHAGTCLGDRARAADRVDGRERVASIEHQAGMVDDVAAAQGAGRAAVADLQNAVCDDGAAAVKVVAGERQAAGALLDQAAAADDHAGQRGVAGAVGGQGARTQRDRAAGTRQGADRLYVAAEVECAVVDGERSRGVERAAAARQRQRAAIHRRATAVAVGGAQRHGAGALLGEAARRRRSSAARQA